MLNKDDKTKLTKRRGTGAVGGNNGERDCQPAEYVR